MLHLNTIEKSTHEVLLSLLSKSYLKDFSLVGGTCLALRYGHRKSIDLDLFSTVQFEPPVLEDLIKIDYPDYTYRGNNTYMLFCNIEKVKTDMIYHPFGLLYPVETIQNIRMFSIQDVAAMKLFAICKRGTKKDFYDVWALLENYDARDLVDMFVKKYGDDKLIFLKKSILYFEEADGTEEPEVFIKKLNWKKVKNRVFTSFVEI